MTTTLANTDKAYLAAIVDDRAVLRVRKNGDTNLPMVAVHSASVGLQYVLAEFTGTKVTVVNRDYQRKPCALHCTERHEHSTSTSMRWSVTGSKATILLFGVIPYMRMRRAEAEDLLENGLLIPWKSSAVEEMAALGWKIPPLRNQPRARAAS